MMEDPTELDMPAAGAEEAVETPLPELPPDDLERRLRREMTKLREQARSAQAERDAAIVSMRAE